MGERKTVKISVLQKSVFGSLLGSDYGDDRLVDIVAGLQRILSEIPKEHRDSARLDVESEGGYEDEHHVEIEIYYTRPETDEEMSTRVGVERADARARAEAREAIERQTLAQLKKKYGE